MNGFYTCLWGNAVTIVACTQPHHISVPVIVLVGLVAMAAERHWIAAQWRKLRGSR